MNRDLPYSQTFDLATLDARDAASAANALVVITDAHSLTDKQRERLESAYSAIGAHLAEHPQFSGIALEVHAQGSMAIGTTVRPEGRQEIDVDLVLSLVPGLHRHVACAPLLDSIQRAIKSHADRHSLNMLRKRRCIQLQYANEMHADVTPVVHHPQGSGHYESTFGLVPDRDLAQYVGTNPKGYCRWFDANAALKPTFSMVRDFDVLAKAEVVPLPTLSIFERLLARIVQLAKIHRNACFATNHELCPPSAFVTTLIVQAYRDAVHGVYTSPLNLMLAIWRNMLHYIVRRPAGGGGEIWVLDNPTATGDNLADRMNSKPERQRAFLTWHARFEQNLIELIVQARAKGGVDALAKQVQRNYGGRAGQAISAAALASTAAQRAAGRVFIAGRSGVTSGAAAAASPAIALASQPHNFHGR